MDCKQLTRLSDQEVLCKLEAFAKRERQVTLAVVLHLGEVERRRLHVSLGYRSLFDYATRKLCYSASAAGRRIRVAGCLRHYPAALDFLRRNEVNLSTLCLASRIMTPENADRVLSEIQNKSQREVEAVVARYDTASAIRDGVRVVNGPPPLTPNASGKNLFQGAHETQELHPESRAESGAGTALEPESSKADLENQAPSIPRFAFRFAASPEFMAKFEEARALLSNGPGNAMSFESVFEAGLEAFLDRRSPARRKARRERRNQLKQRREQKPVEVITQQESIPQPATGVAIRAKPTRGVPTAIRDEVFTRDGRRCSFVGANGQRCDSRYHVQIDHIEPFGLGGPSTVSNLRLLCAAHNLLEAERVYGPDEIRRFRRQAPRTPAAGAIIAQGCEDSDSQSRTMRPSSNEA